MLIFICGIVVFILVCLFSHYFEFGIAVVCGVMGMMLGLILSIAIAGILLFNVDNFVAYEIKEVKLKPIAGEAFAIIEQKNSYATYYLKNANDPDYKSIAISSNNIREVLYSDTEVPTLYLNHYQYKSSTWNWLLFRINMRSDDYTLVVPKGGIQYGN